MDLTDRQWEVIEPLLPERDIRSTGRGRPRRPARDVLNGVLWILRTGAQWSDLPDRYPPYQTCHRRYQAWVNDGTMEGILRALAEDLRDRGKLDLTEGFIDGTHAGAKKGDLALEKLVAGRPPRSWQSQTAMVFLSPLGLQVVRDMRSRSSTKR
jgi:transposase